jgi:hypothetical protein
VKRRTERNSKIIIFSYIVNIFSLSIPAIAAIKKPALKDPVLEVGGNDIRFSRHSSM